MKQTEPVILIPAYKPDTKLLQLAMALVEQSIYSIVIVDDGNTEAKAKQVLELLSHSPQITIIQHETNRGKGAALKTGMRYIQQHYPNTIGCVTADADGQHLVDDILAVAQQLELYPKHLILGTRQFNQADVPFRSKFGNIVTAKLFRLVTGIRCDDTQTGLRGIPASEFDHLQAVEGERFEFEMNQLLDSAKRRLNFNLVPIQTVYLEGNQSSHFNPIKDSLYIMQTLLKFGLSSVIGTVIDFGLFMIFSRYIFAFTTVGILLSNVLARVVSGIVNYRLNEQWVFQAKNKRSLVLYSLLFIGLMAASSLLVAAIPGSLKQVLLAKFLIDGGLFCVSYYVQRRYIFNDTPSTSTQSTTQQEVSLWHG